MLANSALGIKPKISLEIFALKFPLSLLGNILGSLVSASSHFSLLLHVQDKSIELEYQFHLLKP
jgi:hypothetical protein